MSKKYGPAVPVVSLFVAFVLIYTWFLSPGTSVHFPLNFIKAESPANNNQTTVLNDELNRVLADTSMDSKTLIIVVINKAYTEEHGMLELFLKSFQIGENTKQLINHVLFVAVDQIAYDRCNRRRLHCYRLNTRGANFTGEARLKSEDFLDIMWRRTRFLGDVLKRGYNFVFSDVDVLWFRNPFQELETEGEDMQISSDWYSGHPFNQNNAINTGFYRVVSNNKTIALLDAWYAQKNRSRGIQEQYVLEGMKNTGFFQELGLKVRFLPTNQFALFCQRDGDFKVLRTVHAACCLTIQSKIDDLKVFIEEWEKYKVSHQPVQWPEYKACIASKHMVKIGKHH